jgi:hypothetical protein
MYGTMSQQTVQACFACPTELPGGVHRITGIGSLSFFRRQNYILVDRSDLFKTGNLFGWNGEGANWYNSSQGKKIYGSYSALAGSLHFS